jgi:hypothetical protein
VLKPLRRKDAFGGPDAAGNAAPKTQGVRALAMSPSADGGNARVGGFLNSHQVEPGAGREFFVWRNAHSSGECDRATGRVEGGTSCNSP